MLSRLLFLLLAQESITAIRERGGSFGVRIATQDARGHTRSAAHGYGFGALAVTFADDPGWRGDVDVANGTADSESIRR